MFLRKKNSRIFIPVQLPLLSITSLLRTRAMHRGSCSHARLVCYDFEWEVKRKLHTSLSRRSKHRENMEKNEEHIIKCVFHRSVHLWLHQKEQTLSFGLPKIEWTNPSFPIRYPWRLLRNACGAEVFFGNVEPPRPPISFSSIFSLVRCGKN